MTKVGLYAIDKSTTLESNKSLEQLAGTAEPCTAILNVGGVAWFAELAVLITSRPVSVCL